MRWPWHRPETEDRSDTFTERLLAARAADAAGDSTAAMLGAVEACTALYGRALAGLDVSSDVWRIQRTELEACGRTLYRAGQAMLLRSGGVSNSWTVHGDSPDPSTWYYDVTVSSPSNARTVRRTADQVALLRVNTSAATPWRGQSPLVGSSVTVGLGRKLEECLAAEHNAAVGSLLAIPAGTPQDQVNALRNDLQTLGGKTALVESTRGGWGDGRQGQPQRDWQQQRIGPEVPESDVRLREAVELSIYAASGVPASLFGLVTGTESREAWRQFVLAVIRPVALQLRNELRRADPMASVSMEGLEADELSQRARAFGGLVKGGMSVADAVAASGLVMED